MFDVDVNGGDWLDIPSLYHISLPPAYNAGEKQDISIYLKIQEQEFIQIHGELQVWDPILVKLSMLINLWLKMKTSYSL